LAIPFFFPESAGHWIETFFIQTLLLWVCPSFFPFKKTNPFPFDESFGFDVQYSSVFGPAAFFVVSFFPRSFAFSLPGRVSSALFLPSYPPPFLGPFHIQVFGFSRSCFPPHLFIACLFSHILCLKPLFLSFVL